MMHKLLIVMCLLFIAGAGYVSAEEIPDSLKPALPSDITIYPDSGGNVAVIYWFPSADDGAGKNIVTGYALYRSPSPKGSFEVIDTVPPGPNRYIDFLPIDTTVVDSGAPFSPAPVTEVTLADKDNDHGHAVIVKWKTSADDIAGSPSNRVLAYNVFRAESQSGPYLMRGQSASGDTQYDDVGSKEREARDYMPDYTDYYYIIRTKTIEYHPGHKDYFYIVRSITDNPDNYRETSPLQFDGTIYTDSQVYGPVQCFGQWFNSGLIPVLIFVICFTAITVFMIFRARRGAELFVRRLAGIEAVDEAIGRATEMGKPILYVLGLGTAAEIATIASFTILGRVAKKVAEYQTGLIVPCYDPIVMTVAQETVKASYMDAGRPDSYDENMVYFVTQSQFAYVAAVNGVMLRELPATNIYMGKFFAESLILAETGALAGSIQIAGTDEIAQIPFFVVACDYTLIGEELYAASAYLGREPVLLGSLKAQDYAKAAVMIIAIVGFITINLNWDWFVNLFRVAN